MLALRPRGARFGLIALLVLLLPLPVAAEPLFSFDATPGKHCEHCQFHAICPTKAAGTVLS